MRPAISIITATRNAAAHLRHCFSSIAAQGDCTDFLRGPPPPIEHIIVDGASTDGTLSIIREYANTSSRNVHYISEPDRGLYDAINKGILTARGDVIGLLHADDFYPSPDILGKVMNVFADPAVDACYGDLLYVREVKSEQFKAVRYWQSGPYSPEKFKWGWMPPHPTFFVRRSVYEKYGLFSLDLGTAADYELMLRFLLKRRIRCAYLPEVLVCMRVGGASNRTLVARLKANRMDRKAWAVNDLHPYAWTLALKPLCKISQWWRRP